MRPSFFLAAGALAAKIYLTHGPQLWYNGMGIIIYKKKLYDSYACAAYRGALATISLALG